MNAFTMLCARVESSKKNICFLQLHKELLFNLIVTLSFVLY